MIRDKMKLVLDGKTAASESEVIPNTIGEMLFVQVDGDASAFTMQVLGRCNRSGGQFVNLTGFDGAFNLKSSITANGVYAYYIEGMTEIKVNLISVVSGSVSAYVATTTAKG
jgi:hypothetical protein